MGGGDFDHGVMIQELVVYRNALPPVILNNTLTFKLYI